VGYNLLNLLTRIISVFVKIE